MKLPRKAYSYIRFSTPEQRLGDSLRRQIAAAEAWCRSESLSLDSTLRDEGISGYRRKNATEGALATFLKAIRDGEVAAGSVLIVESLDRLSRAEPLDALDLLRDILRAGVELVTLHDRQRYTSASMRDIGPLLQALVIMSRAHEESHIKAQRLSESWSHKRAEAEATKRPMTRQVPAWIRVEGVRLNAARHDWSNAHFALIPERVEVLREIFERRASGWGRRRIASELTKRGIAVWGRGRRRAKGGWQESYIFKLLTTRAVLGEFRPHRLTDGRGSKRQPVGEPILGYYPSAIASDLWHAAQKWNVEATPIPGRVSTVLFTGLAVDPDGAPMHVERKGEGCDYLATARAFRRERRPVHRWRLDHLEQSVLMICRDIDWGRVLAKPSREPEVRRLRAKIAEVSSEEASVKAKIDRAAAALLSDLGAIGEALQVQATELTQQRAQLQAQKKGLQHQLECLQAEVRTASAGVIGLQQQLGADVQDPAIRERLRRELRSLVRRITLFPTGDVAGFPTEHFRAVATSMLTGNQGLFARANGQVCGALQFQFATGKELTVWVTHRPSARTKHAPVVLGVHGLGYDERNWNAAVKHVGIPV